MKMVCAQYAKANTAAMLHPQIAPLLEFPISPALMNVAHIFLNLQQARHLADYDISYNFNRIDVLAVIDATVAAFNDWEAAKFSANAQVFLIDLLLRKFWSRV